MRGRAVVSVAPLLALVLITAGGGNCSALFGVDCNLIGCSDGLVVRVTGTLPAPATVRVVAADGERSFQCDPSYACLGYLEDWMPDQVRIHVTWAGGSESSDAWPRYERVYPNGRACPAACSQGEVEVGVD